MGSHGIGLHRGHALVKKVSPGMLPFALLAFYIAPRVTYVLHPD